ncbi:MAG: hypothetical protein J6X37_01500 [Treponema sp.]|nr:hypothetical protein [Treponema sp.]
MKKLILSIAAIFVIGAAAFAQEKDYSTVDIGFTFPVTIQADNDYSDAYMSTKAFGIYAEYYEDFTPMFGITTHGFLYFAGHPDFYLNGDKVSTLNDITYPLGVSVNLMPTLNIPIGSIVELRFGAGIGFTYRAALYDIPGDQIQTSQWLFAIPVMAAVQVNFTDFIGLKAGCDVQFTFAGFEQVEDYDQTETIDAFTTTILPYVGVVFMF